MGEVGAAIGAGLPPAHTDVVSTAATSTMLQLFDPYTQMPMAGMNYQLTSNFGAGPEQSHLTDALRIFRFAVRPLLTWR